VLEIAKGRIWTGQEAKNLGLVDELGGYDTALKLAKKAAGVPESDDVKIVVYPRPKTFYQSVIEAPGPDNSDKEAVGQTLCADSTSGAAGGASARCGWNQGQE